MTDFNQIKSILKLRSCSRQLMECHVPVILNSGKNYLSMGAFTRSDISHLLPVINFESDTALPRQKDHTALAELCELDPSVVLGHYYRQHL